MGKKWSGVNRAAVPKTDQFVLHRSLQFGEHEVHAFAGQPFVQRDEVIQRGGVDPGDGLCGEDDVGNRVRGLLRGFVQLFPDKGRQNLPVAEEQRCIKTEDQESGDSFAVGVPLEVVIAGEPSSAPSSVR